MNAIPHIQVSHYPYVDFICLQVEDWTGVPANFSEIEKYIYESGVSYKYASELAEHCDSIHRWFHEMGEAGLAAFDDTEIIHVPTIRPTAGAPPEFDADIEERTTIDHPSHHARASSHPTAVECIDLVEHLPFCVGNAIRYVYRANHKNNATKDYRKAAWYLRRQSVVSLAFVVCHPGLRDWSHSVIDYVVEAIFDARAQRPKDARAGLNLAAAECERIADTLDGAA